MISNGQPPGVLTEMNSTIRRIDLICKLLAPVFSGFIISFISLRASAVTLALWNTSSVWLQYWLLTSVYNGIPALINTDEQRKAKVISTNLLENGSYFDESASLPRPHWWNQIPEMLSRIPLLDAWIVYSKQEVVLPGVSLALLYFTVLRCLIT